MLVGVVTTVLVAVEKKWDLTLIVGQPDIIDVGGRAAGIEEFMLRWKLIWLVRRIVKHEREEWLVMLADEVDELIGLLAVAFGT